VITIKHVANSIEAADRRIRTAAGQRHLHALPFSGFNAGAHSSKTHSGPLDYFLVFRLALNFLLLCSGKSACRTSLRLDCSARHSQRTGLSNLSLEPFLPKNI
jgi:hypothetical protein